MMNSVSPYVLFFEQFQSISKIPKKNQFGEEEEEKNLVNLILSDTLVN